MIYLIPPHKGKKANSVDEAIDFVKEYLDSETPLEVELIYFTSNAEEEIFMLNFQLTGFSDSERQVIPILNNITKDEANKSWITIYK